MSPSPRNEFTTLSQPTSPLKFARSFREQVYSELLPLLEQFEAISLNLAAYSGKAITWQPPVNLHELLDHYLDTLLQVYLYKYYVFSQSLIQVLNRENYLLYGLIGRAIIEHTAVLRYYVTSKMLPLARVIVEDGKVTEEELQELIQWLDKHLTGRRFDWDSFLADYFSEVKGIKAGTVLKHTQVNVITCLQKWEKENPAIINLYELFCDLVHPNLGSTLLITRLIDNQLAIGSPQGQPIGREILNRTFASLLELFEEVQDQLVQLQGLKFREILRLRLK